jgi:uncharacterized protein YraI
MKVLNSGSESELGGDCASCQGKCLGVSKCTEYYHWVKVRVAGYEATGYGETYKTALQKAITEATKRALIDNGGIPSYLMTPVQG